MKVYSCVFVRVYSEDIREMQQFETLFIKHQIDLTVLADNYSCFKRI